MLRVGICDDESCARETLKLSLQRLLKQDVNEINIYEFSSGEGVIGWLLKHTGELDLLFLDIEMYGLGGMDTARRIREWDDRLIIVFVTGYSDYVFEGYTVDALDYLIKPVKEVRLKEVLTRALGRLHKMSPEIFTLSNTDGLYRIPKGQILYFFSDRRRVVLVTAQREYPFYEKLDNVAKVLGAGFVRIHQRYLVHAAAVRQIEGNNVFVGEKYLPISRAYRQQAMLSFARAILEREDRI